jgi:hypothetical protein
MSEFGEGQSRFDAANRLCFFVLSRLLEVTEEAITHGRELRPADPIEVAAV